MSHNLEEIFGDFQKIQRNIDRLLWIAALGVLLSTVSLIRQQYDASFKSNTPTATITPTPTMTPTPIQTATWVYMTAEAQATPQR